MFKKREGGQGLNNVCPAIKFKGDDVYMAAKFEGVVFEQGGHSRGSARPG